MGIAEEKPFHPQQRDPESLPRKIETRLGYTPRTTVQREIADVCDALKEFLIAKNDQYGNSAIDPVRIFSKASTEEQLRVRIDDKISRLVRGNDSLEADDDIVDDLIGYFVLWKVVSRRRNA
jgi:hypothetical protein